MKKMLLALSIGFLTMAAAVANAAEIEVKMLINVKKTLNLK